uniref:Uncharacterized protein n=1 Tax=Cucumis melo TaxID=3656 RepID=A0A9I9EGF8_CUCME
MTVFSDDIHMTRGVEWRTRLVRRLHTLGIWCKHNVKDGYYRCMNDVRYTNVENSYSRRIANVRIVDIGNSLSSMELVSRRVSFDGLLDICFCVKSSILDVFNTYDNVFMHQESPHFLKWISPYLHEHETSTRLYLFCGDDKQDRNPSASGCSLREDKIFSFNLKIAGKVLEEGHTSKKLKFYHNVLMLRHKEELNKARGWTNNYITFVDVN